jgi:hypothetical protein
VQLGAGLNLPRAGSIQCVNDAEPVRDRLARKVVTATKTYCDSMRGFAVVCRCKYRQNNGHREIGS